MLPTEDLFVYVYALIDDLVTARIIAIPPRPGPAPACSDAELRCHLARQAPADDCQQIDTSALPVKHTSRARGPDSWTGPGGLHARFGRDATHAGRSRPQLPTLPNTSPNLRQGSSINYVSAHQRPTKGGWPCCLQDGCSRTQRSPVSPLAAAFRLRVIT